MKLFNCSIVTFLYFLFKKFEFKKPVLIVASLSKIVNWERELKNWTDLGVITYDGLIAERDIINFYKFCIKNGNIFLRLFDAII
jgi:SNF2 family DNA or RNA helicase